MGLAFDGQTTGTLALRALRRYPDRIAFASDGVSVRYAHVLDRLARMQQVFHGLGLRPGAAIGVLSSNRWEAWCCTIAAQALALRTTYLHPMGSLGDHLNQLADAEITVLIVDADNHAERGEALAAQPGPVTHLLSLGKARFGRDLLALSDAVGTATPQNLAVPSDICLLGFTSGTTGRAKGAVKTHAAIASWPKAILADFELPETPHYLAVAPISHVAGTKILPVLLRGGTIHLLKGFDSERVLATIAQARINMTLLVPTMIYMLLDHPRLSSTDLSSLELLLYGASPMSPTRLREGLDRFGPVFSQLYGLSECYPIAVLRKSDHDIDRPELFSACGVPVSSCTVALLDEAGNEVPQGEPGEICVRAPQAMDHYWRQPEATEDAFRFGWLHTGDVARADERGYLYIVDRKKDMIVSGGFNVYPREIEDVLTSHPAVAMAAVIGVPDAKWGEAVAALIVKRPGVELGSEELIALVKSKKGAVQAPKLVQFLDALPVTAVGKIDKKILRAQYWAGQERMVG